MEASQALDAESLERFFVTFAQTSLASMEIWATSEGIPHGFHRFVTFTEHGYTLRYEAKPAYRDLLLSHFDHPLWTQKEVEQFVRKQWATLQTAPTQGNISLSLSAEQVKELLNYHFLFPIQDVLERYGTFHPTEEQLLESYSRYHKLWATDSIKWDVTIPLLQFTSDLKQPECISTHLQLAPFTQEEKTAVWNQSLNLDDAVLTRAIDFNEFLSTRFKLVGSHNEKRDVYGSQELRNEVEDIITALRLVKAGDVRALAYFETAQIPRSSSWSSFISLQNDQPIRQYGSIYSLQYGSTYMLSEADLPVVKTLYTSLHNLDTQKRGLSVALRRFNQAYGRELHEDRIIDLNIALESCLLAGDKESVKKNKLASRGVALLAATRDRGETEALLREMYMARNDIVHGGMLLSELEKDLTEFPQRCENVVRDILKKYVTRITHGLTVKTVNAELDRQL